MYPPFGYSEIASIEHKNIDRHHGIDTQQDLVLSSANVSGTMSLDRVYFEAIFYREPSTCVSSGGIRFSAGRDCRYISPVQIFFSIIMQLDGREWSTLHPPYFLQWYLTDYN